MFTRPLPAVAATLAAALAVAACGSSPHRSSSAAGRPSQAQIQQDLVAFAHCMRSHGMPNFHDPSSPRQFKAQLDPSHETSSPAFQSADTACRHLLPGGRAAPPTAAQTRARVAAALAFARCIRGHGFARFPDPSSTGDLSHEMLAQAGIDIHQPALLRAADACVGVTHGAITKADVAHFAAGR